MNRPSKFELIKQFRYHSKKIANLNCKILFITACLSLGITPNGLQPKFPLSALPSALHRDVRILAMKTSFELTNLVLQSYKSLVKDHGKQLETLHQYLILHFPDATHNIDKILLDTSNFISKKCGTLLKKLNSLCIEYLKAGVSLPTSFKYNFENSSKPPLFDTKPCLAELYNLPPPTTNLTNQELNMNDQMPNLTNQEQTNVTKKTEASEVKIENFSLYKPNKDECSVLSKGLTFSPTPKFDHINLVTDALSFARNIRLKYYFQENPSATNVTRDTPECLNKFKEKSGWQPPPLPPDHPIEQFINVVISNLSNPTFPDNLPKEQNLTPSEMKAVKSLKNNQGIVILPSDKGNSIVILDKEDYIAEGKRQLNDTLTYKLLDEEPTTKFKEDINTFLEQHGPEEELSPSTVNLLKPNSCRTPVFYMLPKTHKPSRPPPGRPIVSSYDAPTERISAFVDDQLQPIVRGLPSYLKDTNHFLDNIKSLNQNQNFDQNTLLVTIDVESLYTNIPHDGGIEAAKFFLNTRPTDTKPSTNFLTTLIKMILTMNNFQFMGQNYLQIKGTAMGTRMAPSYANLFMGLVEQNFLSKRTLQPTTWLRFIDDIFLIWQHGLESLNSFLNDLNNHCCLNFTWKISSKSVTFLDVDVFFKSNKIQTKIHVKKSNKMQYLHYSSCHPMYMKKSIPKSLSIRAKILCSDNKDFENYLQKLNAAFIDRGYPKKLVNSQIRQHRNNNTNNINLKNDPKFVTMYYPGLHKINNVMKAAFDVLKSSPSTENLFSRPPRVIFKRPQNLKNILVKPKFQNNSNNFPIDTYHGCKPCKKPRCGICKIMDESTLFKSSSTDRVYPIVGASDCETTNSIYQLTCKHCPKDYIGQTSNSLRTRMTGHRFDVVHKDARKPIYIHANEHNQNFEGCYKLKSLKTLKPHQNKDYNRLQLLNSELAHQLVLKSRIPHGLNLR